MGKRIRRFWEGIAMPKPDGRIALPCLLVSIGDLDDLAKSYLPQLGLYGSALQRAVGKRPTVTLHFLRDGTQYTAAWDSVDAALMEARARGRCRRHPRSGTAGVRCRRTF